jgi:hypothetical protein
MARHDHPLSWYRLCICARTSLLTCARGIRVVVRGILICDARKGRLIALCKTPFCTASSARISQTGHGHLTVEYMYASLKTVASWTYISTHRLTLRNQGDMYLRRSRSNRNILDTPFTPSSLSYRSKDRVTPLRHHRLCLFSPFEGSIPLVKVSRPRPALSWKYLAGIACLFSPTLILCLLLLSKRSYYRVGIPHSHNTPLIPRQVLLCLQLQHTFSTMRQSDNARRGRAFSMHAC